MLSYDFAQIEFTVRQEIQNTAGRLNADLAELARVIAPLQQTWTREAADAFGIEQARWNQSATALNDILYNLAIAVGAGADDVAGADRQAAAAWTR